MEEKMVRKGREWIPNPKFIRALFEQNPKQNVIVATYKGRKLLDFVFGQNIVTTTGEIYYAQKACGESPTNAYLDMYLGSNGPATPAKTDNRGNFTDIGSSNKANSAGYPKSNDNDTDNTGNGANTISWLFSYAANDGNFANIGWCYITKHSPAANDSLLCSVKFGANWNKDGNTSAKVFVNHAQNGV
jgi:hypothetical protein